MKKTIIALAALAFSGCVLAGGPTPMAAPAAPQDNMYLGFHADMTSFFYEAVDSQGASANMSTAMAFNQAGFQVGMLFGAIRTELSISFNNTANNTANLGAFVKGAYDLQLGHGLSVYPVAGIGLVHFFQEGLATSTETDFTWLLGAGTTLALNDKTSISGEYNWVNISHKAISGTIINPVTGQRELGSAKDFGANVFSVRWNRTF